MKFFKRKEKLYITDKGLYLLEYCKKIMCDEITEENKNDFYESDIKRMSEALLRDFEKNYSERNQRILATACLIEYLEGIK